MMPYKKPPLKRGLISVIIVAQAIASAGGKAYNYLYSTVTIGVYLAINGFERISVNQDLDAQFGDVVLMSWGADMASSGGAGGHIGVMDSATNFISCDYWTGGQANTAVSEHDWNEYYNIEVANGLKYIEVWRYNANSQAAQSTTSNAPKVPESGTVDNVLNVGDYFRLHSDRIEVFDVNPATNGVAFGTRYGNIWASAATLTEVK